MTFAFTRWQLLVRLRECRKLNGFTQKQAAAMFDVTERNWQKYESGDILPTLEKLIEIADSFGVSIDYLLGRSETPDIDLSLYPLKQQIFDLLEKQDKTPAEIEELRRLQAQYQKATKTPPANE